MTIDQLARQDETRFDALKRLTRFEEATRDISSPVKAGEIVRVPLSLDTRELELVVTKLDGRYQFGSFVSSEGFDRSYENLSLTFNPDSEGDPHHSTLGCEKLSTEQLFYASKESIARVGSMQNSYYDTYGFRHPSPVATQELGFVTKLFKRSLVRSRLSFIRAGQPQPSSFFWGWHKDEPVFENLRVNIHVTDSQAHRIQIMKEDRMPMNPWDADIAEHRFEVGFGYSWDTIIPHRACAIGMPAHDRAALIYGVSPWFDYDAKTDTWAPNEFFGKKHPLQMLIDGDVL